MKWKRATEAWAVNASFSVEKEPNAPSEVIESSSTIITSSSSSLLCVSIDRSYIERCEASFV